MTVADPNAAAPGLRLPRTVGKYRLLEEVQAGGMGVVYKAHDTKLDRIIALKMIKGGLLATDEEVFRFRQEALAIARLSHPNIVQVHENGEEEGRHFFTMAFAGGGNLSQQQRRFFVDARAAAALVEKVSRAVHYAHQRGILHRDLKPANILFDEHGIPWVSDFGLAKLVDASLDLTRADQLLGTPSYMAPEQAAGHTDQISPQTDVWALGVILYELLTGQRPFKGGSQEEQLRKVRTAEPPQPRSVNRFLDRGLETVILKCLEKEPSCRYASAEALADDLDRWQRGEPVLARPPSWLVRAGRTLRRYRFPALGLGLAVTVLVLLLLAWKGFLPFVTRQGASEAKPEQEPEAELSEEMKDLLDRLENREKVTLIGASGPPKVTPRWPSNWLQGRTTLDSKQFFQVSAEGQPGVLELLPFAPKRFLLRAEVQHRACSPSEEPIGLKGRVGIYFGRSTHRAGETRVHCFFQLTFNDHAPAGQEPGIAPRGQDRLTHAVCREKETGFLSKWNRVCLTTPLFIPEGKAKQIPWRTLEVEVTPESIKAIWENQPLTTRVKGPNGEVKEIDSCDPIKTLNVVARELISMGSQPESPGNVGLELNGGQGLGIYVEQGTAAFRSVKIEPLP
jgi:serine/threonine-protein kinase